MKTAILFVHGFIGASRQFKTLADRLTDSGADMFFQVLPGHEASLEEFRKTGAKLWQDSVNARVAQLEGEYDGIILVGHSMGGLLSACAAVARPEKIKAVVAICFPLSIKLGREWLALNMAATGPKKEGEDPRISAARSMAGVPIRSVGEYLSTLPQNMQFLKTTRMAKRVLPELRAPLTVINAERDEIVSPAVPDQVLRLLPGSEIFMLKESYHFYFTPEEEEFIASLIRDKVRTAL